MVEFGEDDLKNFNAEKAKLIKDKTLGEGEHKKEESKTSDEAKLLKSLFVTQVEDAIEDFEKEKDEEVEQ